MSLQNGTFSLTRYRVLGRTRRLSVAELNQKLQSYQARPVNLKGAVREFSCGWVIPDNPELEEAEARQESWDISDCLYENGLLLRFRIERRSVSAQLLQEMVRQRWNRQEFQTDSDEPQRIRKKQVLDEVKEELLSLSLPSISYIDAYWQDQDDSIYLFSQSKMALQSFEELFHKTFGQALKLGLFRLVPPLLGLDPDAWLDPKPDWMDRLKRTLPVSNGRESDAGPPPQ
ncbi:MAG: recombination-associated protein RdgC [Proteobacteria bacterium]|nr:recombination-associated protein RdgC [Pseudomonadota bacterium]